MQHIISFLRYASLSMVMLFVPLFAWGEVSAPLDLTAYGTIRFNNENWHTLPHPKVATFSVHEDGSTIGFTENGISFVQYNVPNTYGIRVQRFEIEDHYHYIVEGEIADTFVELSSLLAQAYERSMAG